MFAYLAVEVAKKGDARLEVAARVAYDDADESLTLPSVVHKVCGQELSGCGVWCVKGDGAARVAYDDADESMTLPSVVHKVCGCGHTL